MAIGIIGLGYVGLPLAVGFAEAGDRVVAVDVDDAKVAAIRAGQSYVEDISSERLAAVADQIDAQTHFAPLARTDAILICVPTPLTRNREPDLGPLLAATQAVAEILQHGQLIVLESTTYPGTTREQVLPLARVARAGRGPGHQPRFLSRARRPGPDRLHPPDDPQDRRRRHRGVHRPGRSPCTRRCVTTWSGSRRRRRRRWPSCWRTSSARSTSPW